MENISFISNTDNKRPEDRRIQMQFCTTPTFVWVKLLTQANVVGLHSLGGVPLTLVTAGIVRSRTKATEFSFSLV
jgi:hypothetical protein